MESKGLWLSVLGTVLMAVLGFGFAHLAESDAIFLDGVFSLVSFIMSLLMVYVSRLLQRNADHRFQLGYASFEPAFNVLQSLVILGVLTMALASALAALSGNGRLLQPGVATVYAVLATAGCLAVYLRLRTIARDTGSELVRVDAFVWLMDCILSSVVLVTFLAVWLLGEHLGDWLPYVDSLMVIVMVLIMLPVPLRTLYRNLMEVLLAAPSQQQQEQVHADFRRAMVALPATRWSLRMSKTGRMLYLQARVLLEEGEQHNDALQADLWRRHLQDVLAPQYPDLELDVMFTADPNNLQPGTGQPS